MDLSLLLQVLLIIETDADYKLQSPSPSTMNTAVVDTTSIMPSSSFAFLRQTHPHTEIATKTPKTATAAVRATVSVCFLTWVAGVDVDANEMKEVFMMIVIVDMCVVHCRQYRASSRLDGTNQEAEAKS